MVLATILLIIIVGHAITYIGWVTTRSNVHYNYEDVSKVTNRGIVNLVTIGQINYDSGRLREGNNKQKEGQNCGLYRRLKLIIPIMFKLWP